TGPGAYAEVRRVEHEFAAAAEAVKARPEQLRRRLEQLVEEREKLQARLAEAMRSGPASLPEGETLQLDGVTVTVTATSAEDKDEIGALADRFREGRRGAVLVLFSDAGRGAIHAAVTDDLVQAGRRAGDLVGRLAAVSGGNGGGGGAGRGPAGGAGRRGAAGGGRRGRGGRRRPRGGAAGRGGAGPGARRGAPPRAAPLRARVAGPQLR